MLTDTLQVVAFYLLVLAGANRGLHALRNKDTLKEVVKDERSLRLLDMAFGVAAAVALVLHNKRD